MLKHVSNQVGGCSTINQESKIDCKTAIQNAISLSKLQSNNISKFSDFGRPGAIYNPGGSGPGGEIVAEDLFMSNNSPPGKRNDRSDHDRQKAISLLQNHLVRFLHINRNLPQSELEANSLSECIRWQMKNQ